MNISQIFSWLYDNLVPFTILLGILVFVHELGHFLVARLCGVRVEVFSLGFGKKLISYKHGETAYCLSLIPLGGYVKMFGEQPSETISESEKSVSYTHKTVWQRMAIVLAGPLMNFFFAVLIFFSIAYKGEETRAARLTEVTPESTAAQAGLQSNDLVLSVNNQSVRSYEEFQNQLDENINQTATLIVKQDSQPERTLQIDVKSIANPNLFSSKKSIGHIAGVESVAKGTTVAVITDSTAYKLGFRTGDEITKVQNQKVSSWKSLNAAFDSAKESLLISAERIEPSTENKTNLVISIPADFFSSVKKNSTIPVLEQFGFDNPELYLEQVVAGSPAEKAEIKKYDKILSINGEKMKTWDLVLSKIKSYDGKDALELVLQRDGTSLMKKVTPLMTSQMTMQGQEDRRFTIGIVPMANIAMPEIVVVKDTFFTAVQKGFSRASAISVMTVMSFVRLFQGEVSHKNIGGMISIGKAAKDSFAMGLQSFLMTMGILSISLFILNLLPIPVLDGGHLVFYTIEVIKGSPLSLKKVELAHQIGFIFLMGLMVLAFFNDFTKFLFKS